MDKSQLELELLMAQKEKVQAEIVILRKTTPVTEALKIISSLIIGIGGAFVAIFGFQFAEIKAEKFKIEAERAILVKDAATQEFVQIQKVLIRTRDSLQNKNDSLQYEVKKSIITLEQLTDKISLARLLPKSETALNSLQQEANAAAINLRASIPSSKIKTDPEKSLNTDIEELFSPKASIRGAAYNHLMAYYDDNPDLIPSLLRYANNHMGNENGIYNTLVILGHLDYSKMPKDIFSTVRLFVEQTRNNGSRTSERADKILKRLPK